MQIKISLQLALLELETPAHVILPILNTTTCGAKPSLASAALLFRDKPEELVKRWRSPSGHNKQG